MKFITIDGDDVGRKITSSYLRNDLKELNYVNFLVKEKTELIANFLKDMGFIVIFCAADGVAGYSENDEVNGDFIYNRILSIAGEDMSFSAGLGDDLRESYIALLSAKSAGKSRLHKFSEI